MKDLLLVLAAVAALAGSASATEYDCKAENFRSSGSTFKLSTQFEFTLKKLKNGTSEIRNLKGSMKEQNEVTIFEAKKIAQDTKYKPRKYLNSIRFETISKGKFYDVYGYLIIEPTRNNKGEVPAHFVFQADQSGGTVDLVCQTK